MFLEYFRLREQPFGVTPDPKYLFPSLGHREALASLIYGIETNLGFGTLIAQPGMGKTTLLFHILEQYRQSARTAFIFNTQCNSYDLLRSFLSELDEEASARDTFQLHERFKQVIASEADKRRRVILVIDEAQNLGDMVMETVRLLSNFESAEFKLLHIILSGQPELAAKLGRPELSQLKQRIPMLTHLPCLSAQDVAAYIDHRLRVAGYQGSPLFTPEAVRHIIWLSRGVPREINRLCFNSLSLAYASSKPVVDLTVIEEVAFDLGLHTHLQEYRQKDEQVEQYQPVAVNAAAAPVRPAPQRRAQGWPRTAQGPRAVESAKREYGPKMPTPFPSSVSRTRDIGPVAVNTQPRRPLPPIQRVRRVSRSSYGWQAYKRPFGYAFLCLTLIAAGWAAVNRWVYPNSFAGAEPRNVSESAVPAQDHTGTNGPGSSAPRSATATRRAATPGQLASTGKADQRDDQIQNTGSSNRPKNRDLRRDTLLASSRTPANPTRSQQSNPPVPTSIPNPPVKEPTVANQGQMEFVRYVRPHYPEEARNRHIEGTVVLSAIVARDGTVKGIKPVSGDPALLKAAELAIRDWVYRPYQINGRPVDVDTEIVINFALPRSLNQ